MTGATWGELGVDLAAEFVAFIGYLVPLLVLVFGLRIGVAIYRRLSG